VRRLVVIGMVLAALAVGGTAPGASSCADRVLEDWAADEHVGAGYPVTCYRDALAKMPSDLKAYSTAPGDIARALHRRLASPRALGPPTAGSGMHVRHVLLVVAGLLVVSVLVLASAARRHRR
jgi:hypothetical protein